MNKRLVNARSHIFDLIVSQNNAMLIFESSISHQVLEDNEINVDERGMNIVQTHITEPPCLYANHIQH